MKPGTLDRVVTHVRHAREKHPAWRRTPQYVKSVADMEYREWIHAIDWENRTRAEEEALDLIAILIRFVEGDDR
jgi:hypothetical protein